MKKEPNKMAGANAEERLWFAGKSRTVLRHRPGEAKR
jgi:hypothetical protein